MPIYAFLWMILPCLLFPYLWLVVGGGFLLYALVNWINAPRG